MSIRPPFADLVAARTEAGFRQSYRLHIKLISKTGITLHVLRAPIWLLSAANTLSA